MNSIKGQLKSSNTNITKSAPVSRTSSKDGNLSSSSFLRTSADLSKSPNDSFVKYNVPCRYYKFGTCKLGDQCRFLHSDKPEDKLRKSCASVDEDDSLDSSPTADSLLSSSPQSIGSDTSEHSPFTFKTVPPHIKYRYTRRPYIHVVVLFAGDPRVTKYAKDIQNGFLDNGIDVYLQSKIEASGQYIKTENLAEIVTNSKSDQVVVLGDRNMKNHTCQAKRKGKLVEMKLDEIVDVVWSDWPELNPKSEFEGKLQSEITDLVHRMSDDTIFHMIEKYCNLRHVKERLDKLEKGIDELKDWKFPSQSPEAALSRLVLDTNAPSNDEKMASKLTNTQKTMIRLHQQLIEAQETLEQVAIENQRTVSNSGRGMTVGQTYTPTELKADLVLERVEEMGDDLEAMGTPLWIAYRQEYTKNKRKTEGTMKSPTREKMPEGSWNCSSCTFTNPPDSLHCEICQELRKESKDDDEWSLTGAAGKKQRKQRALAKEEVQVEPKKVTMATTKPIEKKTKSIDRPPGFVPVTVNTTKVSPPMPTAQATWKTASMDKPVQPPIARPAAPKEQQYDNNYPPLGKNKKNDVDTINNDLPNISEFLEQDNEMSSTLFNNWLDNKYPPTSNNAPSDAYGNPWMSAFAPLQNNFSLSTLYTSPSSSPATTAFYGQQNQFFSSSSPSSSSFLRNSIEKQTLFTPQNNHFNNIQRPCCYCGEESYLECNNCAKYGMATYFCSPEHQSLVWKDHLDYHRANDLPYNKF